MDTNISSTYSWLDRAVKRFKETGLVIPPGQRKLYRSISDHWAHGKTLVDIGFGVGVGSHILSWNSRFVWGLDVNKESIAFAKEMYKRPNLDFDYYDIENPPSREVAKFEIVVMSEILEHLENPELALVNVKCFFLPHTVLFVTVPNINNPEVKERDAANSLHLHHWTAGEFYELMTKYFNSVTLFSVDKLDQWTQEETIDGDSTDGLIVAKCEYPK